MRTTLTIDDDVIAELKRRAHERDESFKAIVNEVLRAGLADRTPKRRPYRMKPTALGLGQSGYDVTKLGKLADQLEDEEIIRKLREGR